MKGIQLNPGGSGVNVLRAMPCVSVGKDEKSLEEKKNIARNVLTKSLNGCFSGVSHSSLMFMYLHKQKWLKIFRQHKDSF